jgi:hypothetical protein
MAFGLVCNGYVTVYTSSAAALAALEQARIANPGASFRLIDVDHSPEGSLAAYAILHAGSPTVIEVVAGQGAARHASLKAQALTEQGHQCVVRAIDIRRGNCKPGNEPAEVFVQAIYVAGVWSVGVAAFTPPYDPGGLAPQRVQLTTLG